MTDAADVIESWYITFRARFRKHAVGIWAVSHHGRVLSFIAAALIAFSTAGPAHAQVEPGHCDNDGLNATKVVAQLAIHGASANRPSATSTVTLTLPRTWQGTAQLLLSPDDSRFKNAVNCLLGGQEGEQGHYTGLSVAVTQTGVTAIDVETIDDFSWIGPQVLGSVDLGPWRLTGQSTHIHHRPNAVLWVRQHRAQGRVDLSHSDLR